MQWYCEVQVNKKETGSQQSSTTFEQFFVLNLFWINWPASCLELFPCRTVHGLIHHLKTMEVHPRYFEQVRGRQRLVTDLCIILDHRFKRNGSYKIAPVR